MAGCWWDHYHPSGRMRTSGCQSEVDAFFSMFDKDKDGRITHEEYVGDMAVASYFTDTDTDKDGTMTRKEVNYHFEEGDQGHQHQIQNYLA